MNDGPSIPSRLQGRSILVVDDQDMVLRVVSRMLTHLGLEVTAAGSGEQALALRDDRDAPFDLVLTDVLMPGIDGIELTRRLLERDPDACVVFMSAYGTHTLGEDLPGRLLAKPFDRVALADTLQSTVADRSPSSLS